MSKNKKLVISLSLIVLLIVGIACIVPRSNEKHLENSEIAFYYTDNGNQVRTDTIPEGYMLDTYTCSNNNVNISWNYDESKIKFISTGAANCKVYLKEDPFFANYVAVEYIESTGTQYIDTGYIPTLNTKMEIKVNSQYIGESAIFGSDWALDGNFLMFYNNAIRWHSATAVDVPAELNTDYVIESGNGYVKVNGTNYTCTPSTAISQNSLKLFTTTHIYESRPLGRFRTYYWKLYEGNTLVRDFIPCYRKSDGATGLYDRLNTVFYPSTGTLNTGLPSEYERIVYIQGTGTQYIDTGYVPTLNTKMEIKVNSQYIGESAIFGSDWALNGSFLMFYNNAIRWHSASSVDVPAALNTDYVIESGNGYVKVNGTNYTCTQSTAISQNSLKLYMTTNNYESKPLGRFRTYYWKIYENNNLIRDYVPCIHKGNNIIGLYDLVNKNFYTNQGTGQFTIPS